MSSNQNLGDAVHYVSHGSKDGKYPMTCRAAFITGFSDADHQHAHLVVLNPTGLFFNTCEYAPDDDSKGGTYHYAADHNDERNSVVYE